MNFDWKSVMILNDLKQLPDGQPFCKNFSKKSSDLSNKQIRADYLLICITGTKNSKNISEKYNYRCTDSRNVNTIFLASPVPPIISKVN